MTRLNTDKAFIPFTDPREYLASLVTDARRADPSLSLRELARRMGYANPSFLSDILNGKRRIKLGLAEKLACVLDLNETEAMAFIKLVKHQGEDHSNATHLSPDSFLELDKFRFIADWYHLAILEMMDFKDASSDPETIAKRLRRRVSPSIVKLAINRLLRLGLLKNENGRLKKIRRDLFVGTDIPSDAVRRHHTQMLEITRESIEEVPVDKRDIRGTFIAIKKTDWTRLKAAVAAFHSELHAMHTAGEADVLIRISTQTIPLTINTGEK